MALRTYLDYGRVDILEIDNDEPMRCDKQRIILFSIHIEIEQKAIFRVCGNHPLKATNQVCRLTGLCLMFEIVFYQNL